jgi:hypothetical protein
MQRDGPVRARLDKSMIVDTLTVVDMRRWSMFRLVRRSTERAVEFCDRCAQVCDAGCRAAAVREHELLRALRFGGRV